MPGANDPIGPDDARGETPSGRKMGGGSPLGENSWARARLCRRLACAFLARALLAGVARIFVGFFAAPALAFAVAAELFVACPLRRATDAGSRVAELAGLPPGGAQRLGQLLIE